MFGVETLRERIAVLERDVEMLKKTVQGAVPVMMLDKDKGYVVILPSDTPDSECEQLAETLKEVVVIKGGGFRIIEVEG